MFPSGKDFWTVSHNKKFRNKCGRRLNSNTRNRAQFCGSGHSLLRCCVGVCAVVWTVCGCGCVCVCCFTCFQCFVATTDWFVWAVRLDLLDDWFSLFLSLSFALFRLLCSFRHSHCWVDTKLIASHHSSLLDEPCFERTLFGLTIFFNYPSIHWTSVVVVISLLINSLVRLTRRNLPNSQPPHFAIALQVSTSSSSSSLFFHPSFVFHPSWTYLPYLLNWPTYSFFFIRFFSHLPTHLSFLSSPPTLLPLSSCFDNNCNHKLYLQNCVSVCVWPVSATNFKPTSSLQSTP